jgi:HYR domain
MAPAPFRTEQEFTITGGAGMYAGATGTGTLSDVSYGPPTLLGKDTWTGTLVVPGANFDVTPPRFSGATSKVVSAKHVKRVRVSFKVTAHDDVDGSVPVTCVPPSGSQFRVGKTRVSCTATDSSGNTGTTRFTITVKAGR